MSRNPHRAGWGMVLTGILWSAAASADCDGIEMATYDPLPGGRLELVETSCHVGSELFLPWIDPGIHVEVPSRAAKSPVTHFESTDLEALGAFNVEDVIRIVPKADE
jgi:hypothetical protein